MNQTPVLTIAIPTFNRCHHLKKRIIELKPQLTDEVQIIVFDNSSDDDTKNFMLSCQDEKIFYRRSNGNLGANGNFSRCLTESNSDWVWVISDDDPLLPNSVQLVLNVIKNSASIIVNFTTHACLNLENRIVYSLEELLKLKDVTSLLHFPSNIYKISIIKDVFFVLATSCVTYAMNVAIIFKALEKIPNSSIELRKETILNEPTPNPRRWSSAEVSMGLSLFPLFIQNDKLKKLCAIQLRSSTRWMLLWALGDLQNPSELKAWKRTVKFTNQNLSFFGGNLLNHFLFATLKSKNFKDLARDFKICILVLLSSVFLWKIAQKSKTSFHIQKEKILSEF